MKKLNFISVLFLSCALCASSVFAAKSDVAKYLFQAHQLFQKKKYDDAILYFKKAVDADPSDATLYYNIGVVYQMKGKAHFSLAKGWYEKALAKDKKLAFAHYNLGVMAFNQGKVDEARKYLEAAKTLKPEDKGIEDALRETKKAQALIKQPQEKSAQKNEEKNLLIPEKQTQPLTKTQKATAPQVTESKNKPEPLTKTQKTVSPSTTATKTKTQPLTKTQKTVAPQTVTKKNKPQPLTKTLKTTAPSVKSNEKTKNGKTKTALKEKSKNVSIKNVEKKVKPVQEKPADAGTSKTVVCADVKNRMPADEKENFSPTKDKQVVVWLELKNVKGKHTLVSRWVAPDGKLYSSGTRDVSIAGGRYRTWFVRKLSASRMGAKKGKWTVEILIDKKPLKKVDFNVQ